MREIVFFTHNSIFFKICSFPRFRFRNSPSYFFLFLHSIKYNVLIKYLLNFDMVITLFTLYMYITNNKTILNIFLVICKPIQLSILFYVFFIVSQKPNSGNRFHLAYRTLITCHNLLKCSSQKPPAHVSV
jgi:hypothetical protein